MMREDPDINLVLAKAKSDLLKLLDRAYTRIPLSKVENKETIITTIKGNRLVLEEDHIKKLKENIPIYLHEKMELPLELTIINDNPLRFKIEGGLWQQRMINYIINKKLEWRPKEILSEEEVSRLLLEYRSLVHIMIKGLE